MSTKFWTKERLIWLRDEALPKCCTLEEAVQLAQKKYKRELSQRPIYIEFKRQFGTSPGGYLKRRNLQISNEASVAPKDNPVFLRKEIARLEKALKSYSAQSNVVNVIKSYCHAGTGALKEPSTFKPRRIKKAGRICHGTPTLFLSDIHHGERVYTREVNGVNTFDMETSRARIGRVVSRAIHIVDNVLTPSEYQEIVLCLGGDMVSGSIHEELRETNELPIFDVVLDLLDILRGSVLHLKERFGRVRVNCVVGNHGRLDRKPRMKHGPHDNYEYMLYHLLKRAFHDECDVLVNVADSYTLRYEVEGTRFLLTHGDQFRGGAGISGIATPLALGEHKLRKQAASMEAWTGKALEFDILMFGHFHQLMFTRSFICNGSIKGFDEYAHKKNFPYEPPQQALFFTTADRGVTMPVALFAEDAKP